MMSWLVVLNGAVVSGAFVWYLQAKYAGSRKLKKDDECDGEIFLDVEGGCSNEYDSFRSYSNSGTYSEEGIPRPRHISQTSFLPQQHQISQTPTPMPFMVPPPPPPPCFIDLQRPPKPPPLYAPPSGRPPPLPRIPQQTPTTPLADPQWHQPPPRQHSVESSGRRDDIDPTEVELGKVLGGGSFGVVHEGIWRGTPVAVKILKLNVADRSGQARAIEEFEKEVVMLSRLRHPNICLFMGSCVKNGSHTIVTELISRGSLWDVLREPALNGSTLPTTYGEWSWDRLYLVAKGIACGMSYLHGIKPLPVLHRDLKSSNILCDQAYCPKICDFGLSRLKAQTVPSILSTRLNQAVMTGNCGTIQWMAPEVLANQKYSETADVFSFGIILWELLVRQCPYGESTPQVSVALAVVQHGERPTLPPDCPPQYRELVNRCWAQDPLQRPSFFELLSPSSPCSLEQACLGGSVPSASQVASSTPMPHQVRPLSFRGPGLVQN